MKKLIITVFTLLTMSVGFAMAADNIVIVFADGSKQIIPLSHSVSSIKSIHFNKGEKITPTKAATTTAASVKRPGEFWGTWQTKFGTTKFYRQGSRLTGYFNGGIIEGKLAKDGKSFEGYWKKGSFRDKIYFKFRGSLLDGKYSVGKGKMIIFRGKKIK